MVRLAAPGAPIHIHAAEQTREVDDCFAWSRMRPVEWLLTQASVDARWCIVHATHMTEREIAALAASGAVAGLAPTTEADLGDGTFPGSRVPVRRRPLRRRQRFEHVHLAVRGTAPARVVAAHPRAAAQRAAGRRTAWRSAARCGRARRAAARRRSRSRWARSPRGGAPISSCSTADDVALAEQAPEDVLDAAIFGPARAPVRDVMAGGRWIVRGRAPRARGGDLRALPGHDDAVRAAVSAAMEFDLLLDDAHVATMQPDGGAYGIVRDGAIGIRDGQIAWVGPRAELAARRAGAGDAAAAADAGCCPGSSTATRTRVRGQSRRRVRAPPARRDVRRHRARGRRHQRHRARHARRDRGRAGRAEPAARWRRCSPKA